MCVRALNADQTWTSELDMGPKKELKGQNFLTASGL